MNTDDKTLQETGNQNQENKLETSNNDKNPLVASDSLEEDIIRNDTIPETKDEPGSNGAYPVGAFDTSKD